MLRAGRTQAARRHGRIRIVGAHYGVWRGRDPLHGPEAMSCSGDDRRRAGEWAAQEGGHRRGYGRDLRRAQREFDAYRMVQHHDGVAGFVELSSVCECSLARGVVGAMKLNDGLPDRRAERLVQHSLASCGPLCSVQRCCTCGFRAPFHAVEHNRYV